MISAPCALTTEVRVSSLKTLPLTCCPNNTTGISIDTLELRRLIAGFCGLLGAVALIVATGGLSLGFVTKSHLRSSVNSQLEFACKPKQYGLNFFFKFG